MPVYCRVTRVWFSARKAAAAGSAVADAARSETATLDDLMGQVVQGEKYE